MRRKTIALFVLLVSLVFALGAAGCGGDDDGDGGGAATGAQDTTGEEGEATKGGTLTTQTDAFEWTGNFDPTGEYLATYLGLYTNLLGRTLMGYKHSPDAEGNELDPGSRRGGAGDLRGRVDVHLHPA